MAGNVEIPKIIDLCNPDPEATPDNEKLNWFDSLACQVLDPENLKRPLFYPNAAEEDSNLEIERTRSPVNNPETQKT